MSPDRIAGDLPEPVKRSFSAEDHTQRQWKLVVTAFTLVAFYALLHKLLIPCFLKLTALRGTAYAKVDFWFIHSLTLCWLLRRENSHMRALSFLCGSAIAYGIVEVVELSAGRLVGWHVFSRMLSSLPVAALSVAILSSRARPTVGSYAWFGAIGTLIYFAFRVWGGGW